jgi:hypothetical protein
MWPTPSPSSWWSYNPTWTGGKIVSLVIKGFHASPLGEQIQASAYLVNRDGTGLRLLYPELGETPLKSHGDPHLSPMRVAQPGKPQSTIAIPGR